MAANRDTAKISEALERLPGVASVSDIRIENGLIENITVENELAGTLTFQRLREADAGALYDFYYNGLTEKSREFFPPYPLFSPPVNSPEEIAGRIRDWMREDDWTVLKLVKDESIAGIGLLKRFKTERPTSGLAVREEYQGKGLGHLIQTVINEQARLLGLNELYATLAQNNTASFEMHKRCGFKETGRLVPHYVYRGGVKEVDRQDIEMIITFSYG